MDCIYLSYIILIEIFVSIDIVVIFCLCHEGVAPFPGATTGTGGRIRDVQATGRGAHVIAGSAGYCFGNLHIPSDFTIFFSHFT